MKYKKEDEVMLNEQKLNVAQKKLVVENMSLVDSIVKGFLIGKKGGELAPRYNIDDAIQDGYLALCRAAIKYSSSKGTRFTTYAYAAIRNAVITQMRTHYQKNDLYIEDIAEIDCSEMCHYSQSDLIQIINNVIEKRKQQYEKKHPKAYDILRLRLFCGYRNKDIAEQLKMSITDVSQKYTLAKFDLQRQLLKIA